MQALSAVDREQRLKIRDHARRQAVWTLSRLSWKTSAFHDAVTALALLAEAENETWGNNATGEFVARFQVYLGGTAVPYVVRLGVLDEVLATERPELAKLVVKALAKIGDDRASRMGREPISDELPELEWQPRSREEHLNCFEQAIGRLISLARKAAPYLEADLVAAAQNTVMLLRQAPLRALVSEFFRAVRGAYPQRRETLRRVIDGVLRRERKYWKQLSVTDLKAIEELAAEFEERSLHAHLLKEIGQHSWDRELDSIDVDSLATELVQNPQALASEWPWLTSGEAAESWLLGRALANADPRGELEALMPSLEDRGNDLRIVCGYLKVRQEQHGTEWLDRWISKYAARESTDIPFLFEVSWRCEATISIASRMAKVLREQVVRPEIVGQLGFGRWGENLPFESVSDVVSALTDREHESTAIAILENRLTMKPEELDQWEEVALKLVMSPGLIRERESHSHYWDELAKKLIPHHARDIAKAIFREQANRDTEPWFSEFSSAADVLRRCADADPEGVWNELVCHLSSRNAHHFAMGFAPGVVERMPADRVNQWVSENIEERASLLAHLVGINLSREDTLAARLLGSFGDNERVASAFFSQYTTGSWSGPASTHYLELAQRLTDVISHTSLPKVRAWPENAISSLHRMAEAELQREEEWDLRRR